MSRVLMALSTSRRGGAERCERLLAAGQQAQADGQNDAVEVVRPQRAEGADGGEVVGIDEAVDDQWETTGNYVEAAHAAIKVIYGNGYS